MVEKCDLCGNLKGFKHLDRFVCNRCFVKLIEKRVKKGLSGAFVKGEQVKVAGSLAKYFMDKVNIPLEFVDSGYDKIVLEMTMDDIDAGFLAGFFGKKFEWKKDDKVVRILASITDEEAVRFAEIKGINFLVSDKNQAIKDFLEKVSKKHPEIRFNLLKNVKEVEKIL